METSKPKDGRIQKEEKQRHDLDSIIQHGTSHLPKDLEGVSFSCRVAISLMTCTLSSWKSSSSAKWRRATPHATVQNNERHKIVKR